MSSITPLAARPGVVSGVAAPPSSSAPRNAAPNTGRVDVWDMSTGTEQAVVGAGLLRSTDPVLAAAYANALEVDDFMRVQLGRNGWDGQGAPLRIVVHASNEDGTPGMNNAYWDIRSKGIYLGDGDGKLFAPLGGALDVLVHETTHAIVDSEVNLRYEGQQGGINESWADVIASLADQRNWRIGEDVFTPSTPGDEIRDLAHPRFGHVSQLPKGVLLEPHDYSGIPSLAAVRVAERVGHQEMGRIWYSALVDHLDSRAGFPGAARATLEAATAIHGATSMEVDAVLQAWRSVGVDPRWKRPA